MAMANRITVEGLRYVQAVAESTSFSSAARKYGVTQPALSNGVAKLEARLGGEIFSRSPRGASPTPFGENVLPLINRVLTALDDLEAEARRRDTRSSDTIRVGVSPLIDLNLITRAYRSVCGGNTHEAPRQLVLREANMGELKDLLVAGDLDIIIVPSVGPIPRFEHRIIGSEPVVLIEQRDADNTDISPVALTELADKELIFLSEACGLTTFTRDLLNEHGLVPYAYPGEALNYRVLEEWSNLGAGAALLPESKLSSPDTPRRRIIDGDREVEIFYEAAWDPHSADADKLRELAERLTQPVI